MKIKTPKINIIKLLLFFCVLLVLAIYGFIANEARKEIYYLCGNFGTLDTLSNVVRQLDTSTFSSYTLNKQASKTELKHSSMMLLNFKSCNVTFDSNNELVSVVYK